MKHIRYSAGSGENRVAYNRVSVSLDLYATKVFDYEKSMNQIYDVCAGQIPGGT